MRSISTTDLGDIWASKKGICLEIYEQTTHFLKGTFYFEALSLSKIEFNAIVSDDFDVFNFVSSVDLYVPKLFGDYTLLFQGQIRKDDIERSGLCLFVMIYSKSDTNKVCTHKYNLFKIKSSSDLKFESIEFSNSKN